MGANKNIRIKSGFTELDHVRDDVRNFIGESLSFIERNRVILSVDEAIAVIILHTSHDNMEVDILLEMKSGPGRIEFLIQYTGKPFNPIAQTSVSINNNDSDDELGIYLYTTIMDAGYNYHAKSGNLLTLTKKLKSGKPVKKQKKVAPKIRKKKK